MTEHFDVVTLGELLIDFTENGTSGQGNPVYEANPGGAVANVLGMLVKLGRKTAFMGKVGKDAYGRQLRNTLLEGGINDEGLMEDDVYHTTLAIVSRLPDGDRDFAFYRNPGADILLKPEEVRTDFIENADVFHFGSLSLTDEPVRSAHHLAMEVAEKAGCLRSYDPNLRESLWHSMEEAHDQIAWGFAHADMVKISDNEIQWFTGKEDYDEGIAVLRNAYPNLKLVCLSMGADGSRAYYKDLRVEVPAFLQETTVDTTGAGDTFGACMLDGVMKYGIDNLDEEKLKETLTFANAAASIVTTKKGAMRVMPTADEVYAFMESRK